MFFNDDQSSITFVGFIINRKGDLINPTTREVKERAIIKQGLYDNLKVNGVKFDDDYRRWDKSTMILKLAAVLGFAIKYKDDGTVYRFVRGSDGELVSKEVKDPDESYVLTTDNLVKMLAIQMRFR